MTIEMGKYSQSVYSFHFKENIWSDEAVVVCLCGVVLEVCPV